MNVAAAVYLGHVAYPGEQKKVDAFWRAAMAGIFKGAGGRHELLATRAKEIDGKLRLAEKRLVQRRFPSVRIALDIEAGMDQRKALDACLDRFGDKASRLGVGHGGQMDRRHIRREMERHFRESRPALAMAAPVLQHLRENPGTAVMDLLVKTEWVVVALAQANEWADRFDALFGRQLRPAALALDQ